MEYSHLQSNSVQTDILWPPKVLANKCEHKPSLAKGFRIFAIIVPPSAQ
jgi:hypothetical protein